MIYRGSPKGTALMCKCEDCDVQILEEEVRQAFAIPSSQDYMSHQ